MVTPKWTRLSARFTEGEMVTIRFMQKHLNLNKYQFVRACVIMGVASYIAYLIATNPKSPLARIAAPAMKDAFGEQTINRIETKMKEKLRTEPELLEEVKQYEKMLGIISKQFMEHKKRGRPPRTHRNRGKPVDKGL